MDILKTRQNIMLKLCLTLFTLTIIVMNVNSNNYYLTDIDISKNNITKNIKLQQIDSNLSVEWKDSVVVYEIIGQQRFKIIPNSKKKVLGIEITDKTTEEEIRLIVYNEKGYAILEQTAINGINSIDMSEQPIGNFILRIVTLKEKKEFKIIKE